MASLALRAAYCSACTPTASWLSWPAPGARPTDPGTSRTGAPASGEQDASPGAAVQAGASVAEVLRAGEAAEEAAGEAGARPGAGAGDGPC